MAAPDRPAARASTAVRTLRALAVASVAALGWQFVTAGHLFTGGDVRLHGAGAIALHVVTGLTALAALALARDRGGPWWPAGLAAAVFAFTFVQAAFGDLARLPVHVPGALALTVGSVWLAAWAFLRLR